MGLRDRIVLRVLIGGAAATLPAWHLLGPWPALVLVLVSIVVAAAVYRVEPPTLHFDGRPSPDPDAVPEDATPEDATPQDGAPDHAGPRPFDQ